MARLTRLGIDTRSERCQPDVREEIRIMAEAVQPPPVAPPAARPEAKPSAFARVLEAILPRAER